MIAATLGLGTALASTGLADALAQGFVSLAGRDPLLQLATIYVLTMLLTELHVTDTRKSIFCRHNLSVVIPGCHGFACGGSPE